MAIGEVIERRRCIMSLAKQLDTFIKDSGNDIFIEADSKYSPTIDDDTEGIIVLEEDANKWGLELRLYLHNCPSFIPTTRNTVYRSDYSYRINDVAVIKEMFDLGYRIGIN